MTVDILFKNAASLLKTKNVGELLPVYTNPLQAFAHNEWNLFATITTPVTGSWQSAISLLPYTFTSWNYISGETVTPPLI